MRQVRASLERGVDALAEGGGDGVRGVAQQHSARRRQPRQHQRAPARVPRPLRKLRRYLHPHLLHPHAPCVLTCHQKGPLCPWPSTSLLFDPQVCMCTEAVP